MKKIKDMPDVFPQNAEMQVDINRLSSLVRYGATKLMESEPASQSAATQQPYVAQTSLPGQVGMKNRQTNNMGDNPLMDDGKQEELNEASANITDKLLIELEGLLKQIGITDKELQAHQVSLKPSGAVKVVRILTGQDMSEDDAQEFCTKAIFKLAQMKVSGQSNPDKEMVAPEPVSEDDEETIGDDGDDSEDDPESLDEFYVLPNDERFSYTTDALGNVSIQDGETGKSVYLQGQDAVELLGQLEMNGGSQEKEQDVLSQYQHVMEAPMDGLAGDLVRATEGHPVVETTSGVSDSKIIGYQATFRSVGKVMENLSTLMLDVPPDDQTMIDMVDRAIGALKTVQHHCYNQVEELKRNG